VPTRVVSGGSSDESSGVAGVPETGTTGVSSTQQWIGLGLMTLALASGLGLVVVAIRRRQQGPSHLVA
jgi:hypothetical protein